MRPRPQSIHPTQVFEWCEGELRSKQDDLAGEEPLEIRVGRTPLSVTMRTPGHDRELAAGFLFTQGFVERREQLAGLVGTDGTGPRASRNIVCVKLARGTKIDPESVRRNFYSTSSCGICGRTSIDAVRVRKTRTLNPVVRFDPEILCRLPEELRVAQTIFGRTGGLHAAALFDARGRLQVLREDVGRHNAVDKVAGWALLEDRLPLSESALVVSGRGGFEIIQKAIVVGIPLVACVSAPTSLAARLARELGLTLVGFLRGRRFVVYSGQQRIAAAARASAAT